MKMSKEELLEYIEGKGYEVEYARYYYNDHVPFVKVEGVTVFIARRSLAMTGLSSNPAYSQKMFNDVEYYIKAYRKYINEDQIFDLTADTLDIIRYKNSTVTTEELKDFAESGLIGWDEIPTTSISPELLKLKKKQVYKRSGIKYREI